MKIKLARTDTYIPKWNGNRDLPAEEQVKIEYRYMTREEEERFSSLRPIYSGRGEVQDIAIDIKTHANEIWDACVKKVSGLFDESGKEITDPKEVGKVAGIYQLITETVAEIKQGLTEQESKNSA